MFLCLGTAPRAKAQTYTVIHNFTGTDGEDPLGNFILDDSGNLYGTTLQGGSAFDNNPYTGIIWGDGTVFKIDAAGNETVLHSFTGGTDGMSPNAGLVRDAAGNLYGTTYEGGNSSCTGPRGEIVGCGTVFKIDAAGNETVLHSFDLYTDGAYPSGLVLDASGNLYGTTLTGGAYSSSCFMSIYGCGTVFKIDAAGNETVLYRFTGVESTSAGLVLDAAGNLYGTTPAGGSGCKGVGCGTVFKIDAAGNETVLYNFTGGTDGINPKTSLVLDAAGNLYGTAAGGSAGYGTLFKIDPEGNEAVLHTFTSLDRSTLFSLVIDPSGNLYGSAIEPSPVNDGVAFRIDPEGNETVLHTIGLPSGALALDAFGNLYGATEGTVFKITLSVPFSSFDATLDRSAWGFHLRAFFTQGTGAETINPVAQGMTLTLGTYTMTIPPGAFHQTRRGWFVYEGMIDGVALRVRISQTGANSYEVHAEGWGVHLALMRPVTVTLVLGYNNGTTVVKEHEPR